MYSITAAPPMDIPTGNRYSNRHRRSHKCILLSMVNQGKPQPRGWARYVIGTASIALALSACSQNAAPLAEPEPASVSATPDTPELSNEIEQDLQAPWAVSFTTDGAALITERDSATVSWRSPEGDRIELGVIPGVDNEGEGGLLGIAIDPSDAQAFFVYFTAETDNRIERFEFTEDGIGNSTPILTGIPKAGYHNGGRIAFGSDGNLYVGTGDAGEPDLAQDPDSLAGKVLRVTSTGEVPPDNPNPDSPVWTLGHRNVQGLAVDDDGRMWASEFGTSIADELNVLVPGGNYGWPLYEGAAGADGFIDPAAQWTPTSLASPSGIAYVGGATPAIYVASLRGEVLWQVPVVGDRAGEPRAVELGELGRLRAVDLAPDGQLWLMTNNTDGRGEPRPGDDRIIELRL